MTDLLHLLPDFPAGQFARLLHVLDTHGVTTTDLLTLNAADLGSRTKLPLLDLKRLSAAVLDALHRDLSVLPSRTGRSGGEEDASPPPPTLVPFSTAPHGTRKKKTKPSLKQTLPELRAEWSAISTLDDTLDAALGGGIPAGYVTEITGESGAGKTQFLLSLLLAVQLPPPRGLGRSALYISTESPLSTRRLAQMLAANPLLAAVDADDRPTLDNILSTVTADLESQDHILQFQVPVEVERRGVGLVVLDSVAANYRAEFERGGASSSRGFNMGARGNELVRLGAHLRELARKYNLAIVVANQVADRFSPAPALPLLFSSATPSSAAAAVGVGMGTAGPPSSSAFGGLTQESPLASRTRRVTFTTTQEDEEEDEAAAAAAAADSQYIPPPPTPSQPPAPPALLLDHQQRWFTGWGDDPYADYVLKTPSLGLVWSTQIACRIALFRKPVYGVGHAGEGEEEDGERFLPTQTGWKRWMKVVFAPHAPASGQGLDGAVRYEVNMGGLKGLEDVPEGDGEDVTA